MGAHRSMVIDGGEQTKSQVRSGPSQIWMHCTMYDPIPFSCKTERVRERGSGSALCLHRWDCDGIRPEAGCLGPLSAAG